GTVVHLQANNTDPSSAFTSWVGCTSPSGNVCTVTMSAAKTVTATFNSNLLKVTLSRVGGATGTVTGVGNPIDCGQLCQAGFPPNTPAVVRATPAAGSVFTNPAGVSCTQSCTGQFEPGTTVELTPTPSASSAFTSWAGCASTNGNVCTVTMSAARTVTATFTSRR